MSKYKYVSEGEVNKYVIFDPEDNLKLGLDILSEYYDKANGDINKALFWYNNGTSGRYKNWKYPRKVLTRKKFYDRICSSLDII